MKKTLLLFAAVAALFAAASCEEDNTPVEVSAQLMLNGENYAVAGVSVTFADATGLTYEEKTNETGLATFTVPPGSYNAYSSVTGESEGKAVSFIASESVVVVAATPAVYNLEFKKVEGSQIIIKELYNAGCAKDDGSGYYANDAYVTLYNNTAVEADASELVIGIVNPGNGHTTNKWYAATGSLAYSDYVPAYGALWQFKNPVKIAPYSSLTIAIFGHINHTATYSNSVDLSSTDYYWMSNAAISSVFSNAKYAVSENADTTKILVTTPFNSGNAWVLSNTSPAFFIGNMSSATLAALVADTEHYDTTGSTTAALWAPKFPSKNILDAVEIWDATRVSTSKVRFPSSVNAGALALTSKLGHTAYRNVNKAATEALPENAGKLVYGYDKALDPSEIDAEASIKAGCHIIYSDTNTTDKDFHERVVSALK